MAMKVGFIGLGIMGRPMALNLRKAGHALWVHGRRPVTMDVADGGGRAAPAPRPRRWPRTPTSFSSWCPTRRTWSSRDRATTVCCRGVQPGQVVVDMSTISPAATRRYRRAARDARRRDAGCAGFRRRDRRDQRHAVDHGGRQGQRCSSASSRCSSPWARTSCTSATTAPARWPRPATRSWWR